MSKTMLINTTEGHECRIAIVSGGRLDELYTERSSSASQVGNIYKGRITNIEPSIQAAFIDFGGNKNGFLHISDVHPQFFPNGDKNAVEAVGRRTAHKTRPPIQSCLKRGQDIIVQMTKEGIGTKGPTMTTYLSIPGRLMVFMPGMKHIGISRKIEDEDDRGKLRAILDQLNVPNDVGIIIRTAGVGRTKRDLQRDLSYLARLWSSVTDVAKETKAPAEIYQESDLVIRTIRDVYDSDITRIICDSEDVAVKVREFLSVAVPRAKGRIELYIGHKGLFEEYGVEAELQRIHARTVELTGGGSLVFDQAEALVAIDVNSGSFRQHSNAEQNALKLNVLAAEEVCRQLRLRDMGGVIVVDFVDMRQEKNRRQVEKVMRDGLKKDRAKSKVLRLSSFGLLELTRQRLRPSLKQSIYSRCPRCDGSGLVMSDESVALEVLRKLHAACNDEDVAVVEVTVAPSVEQHLSNAQRRLIADLETSSQRMIHILADSELTENDIRISCKNSRGSQINWETPPPTKAGSKGARDEMPETVEIKRWLSDKKNRDGDEGGDQEGSEKDEQKDDGKKDADDGSTKKRRKRGRRGGRRRKSSSDNQPDDQKEDNKNSQDDRDNKDSRDDRDNKDSRDDRDKKDQKDQPETQESDADSDKDESKKKPAKRSSSRGRRRSPRKKSDATDNKDEASKEDKRDNKIKEDTKDNKDSQADSESDNKGDSKTDAKSDDNDGDDKPKKKRRRGRRGGRRHKKKTDDTQDSGGDEGGKSGDTDGDKDR